mmetsp:Transcript_4934/g.3540  ORF Transcript_4934/g.3540 Transcript_4934/m.3540 type:complete len:112 (-) Transcript_4934:34-369(-)
MTKAFKDIEGFEKKLASINLTYKETCLFFLIDKGDEKASNSMEFFKFFVAFFDSVAKAMPKEEKKKPAARGKVPDKKDDFVRKHQIGQKIGGMQAGMGDLMAELKKKQGQV